MTKEGHNLLFGIYLDNADNWSWEIHQGDYAGDYLIEIVRMLSLSISQIIETLEVTENESSGNVNVVKKKNGGIAS